MSFNLYSERTKCPECKAKVRLDYVRFTPTFKCPACQAEIQVSPLYLKILGRTSMALALFIAYILAPDVLGWITVDREDRWSVMFLLMTGLWFLFSMILAAILSSLWAYIVKYWLPPRLLLPDRDPAPPGHFQGLGLGPK
jgi:hypothetical protein